MPLATASVATILADLDARLKAARPANTAAVRLVRRRLSVDLKSAPAELVRRVAFTLMARDDGADRFIAAELLAAHPAAMGTLDADDLRRLGRGMDSWDDVDVFACFLSGPAWRGRQLSDAEIRRWARSPDRWWRRAAVVSTVPLNNRARGGSGDPTRTLALCRLVLADRDPMVVKALSWALRELAKRDPTAVRQFISEHESEMPALARREVRTKLETGLKAARKR
jgi:3-methyladenine DNA glycosylase AlkD